MPAISASVIHCAGEQVFFALDLNEVFNREPHTHSHRAGGTHAGVSLRWATSRRLHLQRSESLRSSLFCSDPLRAAETPESF